MIGLRLLVRFGDRPLMQSGNRSQPTPVQFRGVPMAKAATTRCDKSRTLVGSGCVLGFLRVRCGALRVWYPPNEPPVRLRGASWTASALGCCGVIPQALAGSRAKVAAGQSNARRPHPTPIGTPGRGGQGSPGWGAGTIENRSHRRASRGSPPLPRGTARTGVLRPKTSVNRELWGLLHATDIIFF